MQVLPIRLRELRQSSGLLQKDIANKLNITTSAYGFYEQGKRVPDSNTLEELAEIFNVSTDYLLGRENKNQISKILDLVKEDSKKYEATKKLLDRESVQDLLDYLEDKDDEYIRLVTDIAIRIEQREEDKKAKKNL